MAIHKGKLIIAINLERHMSPSFGNNSYNETEDVIGDSILFLAGFP